MKAKARSDYNNNNKNFGFFLFTFVLTAFSYVFYSGLVRLVPLTWFNFRFPFPTKGRIIDTKFRNMNIVCTY